MSEFFIAIVVFLVYVGVMCTWFFALFDLFGRSDLSGLKKALWLFFIIFIPFIGVLSYLALRPRNMAWLGSQDDPISPRDQAIADVTVLIRLRNEGTITDEEYQTLKQRALA